MKYGLYFLSVGKAMMQDVLVLLFFTLNISTIKG